MGQSAMPQRGIALVLGAVFLFACQDAAGKYLFGHFAVPFVQAIRYGMNLLLLSLFLLPRRGLSVLQSDRKPLLIARGLALALGSLFGGLALKLMPLAEMVSILYLNPLIILFLSMPILGEKVRWYGWVATSVGFVGLLFIVRPGTGLSLTGLGFSFLCLLTAVIYPMLSRLLAKTETTETQMFYVALVGAVFYGVQVPWTLPAFVPTLFESGLLLALGVISLLGHFMFTAAYARAPVSLLAPFTYVHIAWATLLGWIIFRQTPDYLTFVGIGLVAAAGVGNAVLNHRSARQATPAIEPVEA
ncbi:MAG: DMT family transporter [Alphaproteobacteria bacterium]|nr:DMT family transporter [Alphaproteobacteria bacterium]